MIFLEMIKTSRVDDGCSRQMFNKIKGPYESKKTNWTGNCGVRAHWHIAGQAGQDASFRGLHCRLRYRSGSG